MDKARQQFSSEEKREQRYREWLDPTGIAFVSSEAEKAYRERGRRLIDAYSLREPDRVPVLVNAVEATNIILNNADYSALRFPLTIMSGWLNLGGLQLLNLPWKSKPKLPTRNLIQLKYHRVKSGVQT